MSYGTELVVVMPGLVPGIHVLLRFESAKTWMAGNISAFTRVFNALCPAMTEQVALP
jgi:hypothetical protein